MAIRSVLAGTGIAIFAILATATVFHLEVTEAERSPAQPGSAGEHHRARPRANTIENSASTDALKKLEARLEVLEREVRVLKATSQRTQGIRVSANDIDGAATVGSMGVSELVHDAIEDERQETLDRRIALRQEVDLQAIEKFGHQVHLTSERRTALKEILFSASAQITQMIDDGTSARRSWNDIRPDMESATMTALDELRLLLSAEEFEEFAKITNGLGTTLIIPQAGARPPGSAPMEVIAE